LNDIVLIVAAHPDDEVLGCGVTINKYTKMGNKVYVIYMSDGVTSRNEDSNIEMRNSAAFSSCQILGAETPKFLCLPDNKMDTIPFLDIVQSLEKLIDTINPSIVFTHHSGDLNIDHRLTHDAVLTACRPTPDSFVREIYSFEVLSSTEWGVFNHNFFIPTKFVDIVDTFDQKMQALHSYNEEMREFPHSRSFESVRSLAIIRGSSVGIELAECFQTIRIIEK